jgi:hypothetical protein
MWWFEIAQIANYNLAKRVHSTQNCGGSQNFDGEITALWVWK